ncbi:MAG: hypothetical protein GW905_07270 [Rhodobacterales bacterium]|nr:hypothetical protein [Rhodobacterales bacterium]
MQKAKSVLILAVLAGCAPYSGYYKAGQTVARLNTDQTACEVKGAQDVPPNTQLRRTPVELIPAREICDRHGKCSVIPARIEGGEVYSYDANADLRARVVAQCMADKGYEKVSIPPCPDSVAKVAASRAPGVLPPLGPNICVAQGADGGLIFVTTAPAR